MIGQKPGLASIGKRWEPLHPISRMNFFTGSYYYVNHFVCIPRLYPIMMSKKTKRFELF
jgi:hypothetical protein